MMTEAERDLQRFEDILKEIGLIRESLKGVDKEAFLSSEDKKAAVAAEIEADSVIVVYYPLKWHGESSSRSKAGKDAVNPPRSSGSTRRLSMRAWRRS